MLADTERVKFSADQKARIDEIVTARLQRAYRDAERRVADQHERAMLELRERHERELATVRAELARARAEKSVLSRLCDRWLVSRRDTT